MYGQNQGNQGHQGVQGGVGGCESRREPGSLSGPAGWPQVRPAGRPSWELSSWLGRRLIRGSKGVFRHGFSPRGKTG